MRPRRTICHQSIRGRAGAGECDPGRAARPMQKMSYAQVTLKLAMPQKFEIFV